jgi:hypothetical protein
MSAAVTIELHGVTVVAESEFALCCQITGRDHWIPAHRLLKGSSVAHFGDRGSIVLARQFAEECGLLLERFRPL